MKKLLRFSLLLTIVLFAFSACAEDDDSDDFVISYDSLPAVSKAFIADCFGSDATVSQTLERYVADSDGTFYIVYLNGGYEVDFKQNGIWVDVENDNSGLPQSVLAKLLLPKTITYLSEHYPNAKVNEVENLGTNGRRVELNNGTTLAFDATGDIIILK